MHFQKLGTQSDFLSFSGDECSSTCSMRHKSITALLALQRSGYQVLWGSDAVKFYVRKPFPHGRFCKITRLVDNTLVFSVKTFLPISSGSPANTPCKASMMIRIKSVHTCSCTNVFLLVFSTRKLVKPHRKWVKVPALEGEPRNLMLGQSLSHVRSFWYTMWCCDVQIKMYHSRFFLLSCLKCDRSKNKNQCSSLN